MEFVDGIFKQAPLLALFVTLSLGYLAGMIRVGSFTLGGVAGTLLVGVAVGQLGITLDPAVKTVFFALFIYTVGFQGGPQFFNAISLRSLNQFASAFVMCVLGLLCVLAAAWLFGLDRGTAAGLAAGGLTQSAIIGTADGAIAMLDLSADAIKTMQANVAVGYAVCYIFGSLGPILMVTWFLPMVMGWNIRDEAVKLERRMSGGETRLQPGQFEALSPLATRVYRIAPDSAAVGKSALEIDRDLSDVAVEAVIRGGEALELTDETVVEAGDEVVVTGMLQEITERGQEFGEETMPPPEFRLVEEQRQMVVANPTLHGVRLGDLHDRVDIATRHGVFVTAIRRMGHELPVLPEVTLHRGDEVTLTGRPRDLDRVRASIGHIVSQAPVTDFIFLGLGVSVGLLLGLLEVTLFGVEISLGTGGGCLLAGLVFGWLHGTHPLLARIPAGASNFLRDFGLAAFVGVVGISAGPQAFVTIEEHGLTLLLLGVGVTLIPQILGFFFSYHVLRIRNPIEALACVAGGRSANPGFAALLERAGNATPVVAFTVTYALANVLLTLWGPVIVGIVDVNAGS